MNLASVVMVSAVVLLSVPTIGAQSVPPAGPVRDVADGELRIGGQSRRISCGLGGPTQMDRPPGQR